MLLSLILATVASVCLVPTLLHRSDASALGIPILIAAAAYLLVGTRVGRWMVVFATLGLGTFVVLGILSVGIFYAPSALAMLTACFWPLGRTDP